MVVSAVVRKRRSQAALSQVVFVKAVLALAAPYQAQSRNSAMLAGSVASVQLVTAMRFSPSIRHTRRSVAPSPSPPDPPG